MEIRKTDSRERERSENSGDQKWTGITTKHLVLLQPSRSKKGNRRIPKKKPEGARQAQRLRG